VIGDFRLTPRTIFDVRAWFRVVERQRRDWGALTAHSPRFHETLSPNYPPSRALDFWITIVADEAIPKLEISIPFGDVSVIFCRFVATQGFKRSLSKPVEVNVRAALFQFRAGSRTCSRDNSSLVSSGSRA
jgi:hypothetical protein